MNREIANDIETILEFVRNSDSMGVVQRETDRIEAWLATYQPEEKDY